MILTHTVLVGPALFQSHEVTHHLYDIGGIEYSLDCGIVNLFHSDHKVSPISQNHKAR